MTKVERLTELFMTLSKASIDHANSLEAQMDECETALSKFVYQVALAAHQELRDALDDAADEKAYFAGFNKGAK